MSIKDLKDIALDIASSSDTPARRSKSAPVALMEFSDEFRRLADEKADLLKRMGEPLEIDIDSIRENPLHARVRKLDAQQIDALVENLRENPLATPIIVRRLDDTHYEVIAGRHRLHAFRALGRTHIPAVVVDFDDDRAARALVFDNLVRPELSDYERYAGIAELRKRFGWSYSHLQERTGITKGWISALMKFDVLDEKAHEALRKYPAALSAKQLAQLLEKCRDAGRVSAEIVEIARGNKTFLQSIASLSNKTVQQRPYRYVVRRGMQRLARMQSKGREITITIDKSFAADPSHLVREVQAVLERWAASAATHAGSQTKAADDDQTV